MLRASLWSLAVALCLVSSQPARAAGEPLDAVSTEASAVVRIKGFDTALGKFAKYVDKCMAGQGKQMQTQAKSAVGTLVLNQTLGGIDQTKDWYIAVYSIEGQDEPAVVFIMPAKDIKALKSAVSEDVKFFEHGTYGVYTKDGTAAEQIQARLKGDGKSVKTLIDATSQALIEKSDVSLFVNVAQLVTTYKDQLQQVKERAEGALSQIPAESNGVDTQSVAQAMSQILSTLAQFISDTKSFTCGLAVTDNQLVFEDLVRVTADSESDKFLKGSNPSTFPALAQLPASQLIYMSLSMDMQKLMQMNAAFAQSMFAGDEKKAADFKQAMAEVSKLKLGPMVWSFDLGSVKDGVLQQVAVTETADPQKLRNVSEKLATTMNLGAPGLKQEVTFDKEAETYGKLKADVATVKLSLEKDEDDDEESGAAMVNKLFKTLFGEDGLKTRSVYLKDRVVNVAGGDKDFVARVIALQEKPAAQVTTTGTSAGAAPAALQKVRSQLPAKSNFMYLIDVPRTFANALRVASEAGFLNAEVDQDWVDARRLTVSYIGLAIGTEPQGLRTALTIPVEQIQGMIQVSMFAQGIIQQGFKTPDADDDDSK